MNRYTERIPMFRLALLAMLFAAAVAAAPDGRVDIDVRPAAKGTTLTVVRASEGSQARNFKPDLLTWEIEANEVAWTEASLTFRASGDCRIRVRLKSRFAKEDPVWMLYDNLSLSGATLVNGDFEQPATSKNGWVLEEQVKGQGASQLRDKAKAQSGAGFLRVWHNGPATQADIAVKAGQELVLQLWARKPAAEAAPPAPAPTGARADGPAALPGTGTPIPLTPVANQGFRDDVAGDNAGGWTDEGPDNDLRSLPVGRQVYAGVTFDILDPAAHGGKSCLVLAAPELKRKRLGTFPGEAALPVALPPQRHLYLLHALGWAPDDPVPTGRLTVTYADGSTDELPVTAQVDVANWWKPQSLPNGAPVWKGANRRSEIGLYLSRFTVQEKPLQSLAFSARSCAWMIVGVSVGRTEVALPKYAPVSFAFTEAQLREEYPAFGEITGVARAMRGEAPLLGHAGDFAGRPARWLHGPWQFLPIGREERQPDGRQVTAKTVFVPAFIGSPRVSEASAYALQPKSWNEVNQMWYSVNVQVPPQWEAGRLVLHFEAVDFLGAVFVDGQLLGLHKGRYLPFDVTLPASLKPGDVFNLSVFVLKVGEAVRNQRCPFMQGVDPQVGGITAPVCLYRDTPAAIGRLRVTTSVAGQRLGLELETGTPAAGLSIRPEVLDAQQRPVPLPGLDAQPARTAMRWEAPWATPHLWSDEDPYLYTLRLHVTDTAGQTSVQTERFGFRDVALRGRDLLLNGVPVRLFGLSYETQGVDAWARGDEEYNYRFLSALKQQFGINAVRFHHTPAFPAILRAADRAGILAIAQSGLWTAGRFANYRAGELFLQEQRRELSEWVWRDLNHPSVVIWDVANEYICGSPEYLETWEKLNEIVRAIDPSRPVEQSGAGDIGAPPIRHYHDGECYLRTAGTARLEPGQPTIFGEFWIGGEGETRPLTLPRESFTVAEFNAAWLRSYVDKLTQMRTGGAAGLFPFHQIENGLIMASSKVPADASFAPASFSPQRLSFRHEFNPFLPAAGQFKPDFVAASRQVYSKVAGLLIERSQAFERGQPAVRHLFLANDTAAARDLQVQVTLAVGGQRQAVLDRTFAAAAGQTQLVELQIPAAATAGAGALEVRVRHAGGEYRADEPAGVYQVPSLNGTLRLYGGSPALAALLRHAGTEVQAVDRIEPGPSPLVIGENALGFADRAAIESLLRRADQRVLLLAQDRVSFADLLGLAQRRYPAAYPAYYAAVAAPELQALGLHDYHYPGGHGAAYTASYAIPMPAAQTPPAVECLVGGTRYEDWPVLRYRQPRGNLIFCQLQLEPAFATDVRSRCLATALVRLLDRFRNEQPGAIYADSPELATPLAEQGFTTTADPQAAALAVVSQRSYAAEPRLQQAAAVLIYDLNEGHIDGRAVTVIPGRHFTTLLVSPTVPGLRELTTGHFYPIILAGKFCAAVNPPTLRELNVARSTIAVVGKRAAPQYDTFTEDNYRPLACYYEEAGRQRWVTGFTAAEPYVGAMASALATARNLSFQRRLQPLVYGIAAAREMAIDGDLQDWTYEGDTNLHNWSRAQPLTFGQERTWGLGYLLADTQHLYLALAAPEEALPVGDGSFRLELQGQTIMVQRRAAGQVAVSVDGRAVAVRAAWQRLSRPLADAGSRAAATPLFGLEAELPHELLALRTRMTGRLALANASGTVSYPAAGDPPMKLAITAK